MNDKEDRIRLAARILAWALLGYIAFVTLGPLRDRPQFGHADAERFIAFAVTGAALRSVIRRSGRLSPSA